MKNTSAPRLAQLISIFISVWLTAAGIIHLVRASAARRKEGGGCEA